MLAKLFVQEEKEKKKDTIKLKIIKQITEKTKPFSLYSQELIDDTEAPFFVKPREVSAVIHSGSVVMVVPPVKHSQLKDVCS